MHRIVDERGGFTYDDTHPMTDSICDLIVLSWNQLEQTRPCLESLFKHTDVPSRLLLVDNGSEPEVRAFLRGVAPAGMICEVRLIQNETNEGFPRGMNRGLRASSAPYVCLLNNDLLMTPQWLSRMIRVAESDAAIGLVGPSSNTYGERPPAGMSIDAYAEQLEDQHARYVEAGMCIGFCVLIKRSVIERIGLLTEEVDRVFFEDEDYAIRAQQAGFRCALSRAAYVFHREHQSVKHLPERDALFERNQRWCREKWGRRLRLACPRAEQVVPGSGELRQWLQRLIELARQRCHVYAYAPTPAGCSVDALFDSVGLIRHVDVLWHRMPAAAPRLAATVRILLRRKKPFDAILAPEAGWAAWFRALRGLHGAQVIEPDDQPGLDALWQSRFVTAQPVSAGV